MHAFASFLKASEVTYGARRPKPEYTSAYCRIQALDMLEDLANTTPPDVVATRR